MIRVLTTRLKHLHAIPAMMVLATNRLTCTSSFIDSCALTEMCAFGVYRKLAHPCAREQLSAYASAPLICCGKIQATQRQAVHMRVLILTGPGSKPEVQCAKIFYFCCARVSICEMRNGGRVKWSATFQTHLFRFSGDPGVDATRLQVSWLHDGWQQTGTLKGEHNESLHGLLENKHPGGNAHTWSTRTTRAFMLPLELSQICLSHHSVWSRAARVQS